AHCERNEPVQRLICPAYRTDAPLPSCPTPRLTLLNGHRPRHSNVLRDRRLHILTCFLTFRTTRASDEIPSAELFRAFPTTQSRFIVTLFFARTAKLGGEPWDTRLLPSQMELPLKCRACPTLAILQTSHSGHAQKPSLSILVSETSSARAQ